MKKPEVLVCPKCGSIRVNRKKRLCGSCGVMLFFPGDYVSLGYDKHMSGYGWTGSRWKSIRESAEEIAKKLS